MDPAQFSHLQQKRAAGIQAKVFLKLTSRNKNQSVLGSWWVCFPIQKQHVVPVSTAFRGQIQEFQALCHECHRLKTSLDNSHATVLESLQPSAPRHARLRHAITYASCQGLTLRGRVWLLDAGTQHFNLRHLCVGASRATSSELLAVL